VGGGNNDKRENGRSLPKQAGPPKTKTEQANANRIPTGGDRNARLKSILAPATDCLCIAHVPFPFPSIKRFGKCFKTKSDQNGRCGAAGYF
jgi:hypothetical protein